MKSKKNIKKKKKHSRKNNLKNKLLSRKNIMRGGGGNVIDISIDRLAASEDKNFTKLDIMYTKVNSKSVNALAKALETNTTLTTLNFIGNEIGDSGVTVLAKALKTNTTLTTLNISNNTIGDSGVTELAEALKTNTTLTNLDISQNEIRDSGVTELGEALKTNTTLTTLNISGNQIGDEGVTVLAEALKGITSLTNLDISMNDFSDEGVTVLAEALKTNKTLTTLNISFNDFGDEGVTVLAEALKTNTTLTTLKISMNEFGNIGDQALTKALENIENAINKNITNSIKYDPILESLKLPNPNTDIDDAITFIDTIIKKENIKNNSLINNGKSELIEDYKTFLSLSKNKDNINFKKLFGNNYIKGKESLSIIDSSNKYIINLHGSMSKNIFKLPDNINIIFLSPISYVLCMALTSITFENIQQYIKNPFCSDNNSIFSEATLYLGGQYCIDLNLSRKNIDKAAGILYVNYDEKKLDKAYLYAKESGKNNFTLSEFLNNEQDHENQNFINEIKQYTFIIMSCREKPSDKTFLDVTIDKLVFYELLIKKLNFYLYFMDDIKRKDMNNKNNETNIITKYNTCKTKTQKHIKHNGTYYFQRTRTEKKNKFHLRNHYNITNNTIFNNISVLELKTILTGIDNSNKLIKFDELLKTLNFELQYKKNGEFYLDDKYKFKIIKYIFQYNYDLMFEFLVYIDINIRGIMNYGYFLKDNDKSKLDVSKINYRITLSALEFIVSNLKKEELITLDISGNQIEDSDVKILVEALKTNTTLTTLNISGNQIGDKGVTVLAEALKTNTTLTTLNISRNQIGNSGAKALETALVNNTTLTTLDISNNKIDQKIVNSITKTEKKN